MSDFFADTKKNKALKGAIIALLIVSCMSLIYHGVVGLQFNRDFKGYLKRAADANSLEMAERELSKAISYLNYRDLNTEEGRNRGWVNDHTSMVYGTPDEQLSFFYDNIVESRNELRTVISSGTATPTDRSNLLIKLRETLIDHQSDGDSVTYPMGLDVYPHNGRLVLLLIVPLLVAGVLFVLMDWR